MNCGKGKEDKKFAQISPDTVNLIADSLGISQLDQKVSRALAEDASYRCREIVNVCSQLLKHSKRRKLTTRDVDSAFELCDVDPVLGHDNGNDPQDYQAVQDVVQKPHGSEVSTIHVPQERLIDLRPFSLGQSPPIMAAEPGVQATWLVLEGQYFPENEEPKPIDCPQQSALTPALVQYYSALTNVILEDSEDLVKMMICDVRTNPKLGTLLPFMVSFIRTGMQKYCDNKILMKRLLLLLEAVFSNSSLNLSPKPYLSHLVTALLSSLIIDRKDTRNKPAYSNPNLVMNIEHVQHASLILNQVLDRWATPVNQLRTQTHRALCEYLKDDKFSFASHYGALSAMIALGPKVLHECLVPFLESYIQSMLQKFKRADDEVISTGAGFNQKAVADNQRLKAVLNLMWGTLILASRSLLLHYCHQRSKVDLSKTFHLMTETFGDSLTTISTDVFIKRPRNTPRDPLGKLRIRRLNRNPSNPPEKSFRDFSFLNDFGMPNDIFDDQSYQRAGSDVLSEGSGRLSSVDDILLGDKKGRGGCIATPHSSSPVPISPKVISEFELEVMKTINTNHPIIEIKATNWIQRPLEMFHRRTQSNQHRASDFKSSKGVILCSRMGTLRSSASYDSKLHSCCITNNI